MELKDEQQLKIDQRKLTNEQVSQKFNKPMKHPGSLDVVMTARELIFFDDAAEEYRKVNIPGTDPMTGREWEPESLAEFWEEFGEDFYLPRSRLHRMPDDALLPEAEGLDWATRKEALVLLDYINDERAEHEREPISISEFKLAKSEKTSDEIPIDDEIPVDDEPDIKEEEIEL
jgi:hypothetical protein